MAELVVHSYRKIVEECGTDKITSIDFLMLVMEKVATTCEQNNELRYPIRQNLYAITKRTFVLVSKRIQILGTLDLRKKQMTIPSTNN